MSYEEGEQGLQTHLLLHSSPAGHSNVGAAVGIGLIVGVVDGIGVGSGLGTGLGAVVGDPVVGDTVGPSGALSGLTLVAPYTEKTPTPTFTPVVEGYQSAPAFSPSIQKLQNVSQSNKPIPMVTASSGEHTKLVRES